MIGWSIDVIRGGTVKNTGDKYYIPVVEDGETLHSIPPTGINQLQHTPVDLAKLAVKVYCRNGYPYLFTIKAGDLPYELDAPDDEVVYVQAWDQS